MKTFRNNLFMISGTLALAAVLAGLAAKPALSQSQTKPREGLSPFTAVKPETNSAIVRFEDNEYELVSINEQSVAELFGFCLRTYKDQWEKRFTEDLVEVLADMGHPMTPDKTVKLVLRDVGSDRLVTVARAPMTHANRQAAREFRQKWLQGRPHLPR